MSNRPTSESHACARVLWIDDQVEPGDVGVRTLECSGLAIDIARTGGEAMAVATARGPDAILLDILLGAESGLDVWRDLRAAGVGAPVVVLTGVADVRTCAAAMKQGAFDYRLKPVDLEEVAGVLRQAAASGRPEEAASHGPRWLDRQRQRLGAATSHEERQHLILQVLVSDHLTLSAFHDWLEAWRSARCAASDCHLCPGPGGPPAGGRVHPKVASALELLEAGAGRMSQRELAKKVGLERAYLSHLIKRDTGCPATEWRRLAVIRAALRRLLDSDEQVSQIAYAVGYDHAAQFDRDFTRVFCACPTDVRRFWRHGHAIGRPPNIL